MAQLGSSIEEVVYSLAQIEDRNTDEEFINMLYVFVYACRSKLIRQHIQKYGNRSLFENTLIFNLELASLSENCNLDLCDYLKTTLQVPSPLLMEYTQPYKVATPDKKKYLDYLKPEHLEFRKHNKWVSKDLVYTMSNGYIYIVGNKLLETISVTAIWDRPDLLEDYECTTCKPSVNRLPANMVEDIIKMYRADVKGILEANKNNGEIDENKTISNS